MNPDSAHNSFQKLYDAEADAIFRFVLIRVSDREKALDITQDAFARMWQALLDGKEMSNARAFLFTIAHNLIIDWYRKKKAVSLEAMTDPETGETYEPPQEGALKDLELSAEGRFLIDAIKRLPPSYRDPIHLRFVEGMSPPEIGKTLGISTNAASVRLTRAIEELRKITGYDIDE